MFPRLESSHQPDSPNKTNLAVRLGQTFQDKGLYYRIQLTDTVHPVFGYALFLLNNNILLGAPGLECTRVFATNTKQDHFSYISKIKPYTSSVRAAILSDFIPNQIRFVGEPPCFQNL